MHLHIWRCASWTDRQPLPVSNHSPRQKTFTPPLISAMVMRLTQDGAAGKHEQANKLNTNTDTSYKCT